MEQFEVIDISPPEELRQRWSGFIHSGHDDITDNYFGSSLAYNPRRTSENFFSHMLPTNIAEAFRESNPVPDNFQTLEELWDWHFPLLEAEHAWKTRANSSDLI